LPPRLIVLAIVGFWIGSSAWLFYRDVWPHLRPNEPPPYTIDLADEARQHAPPIQWRIKRGDKTIGTVQTAVRYRASDDTFEMQSKIPRINLGTIGPLQISARALTSTYRVTREGELREVNMEGSQDFQVPARFLDAGIPTRLTLQGKVDNGFFTATGDVEWDGKKYALPFEPVPVSGQGSILNPLHPVNRIVGLRRGQHWRVPLVDPLAEAVRAMVQKNPVFEILAKQVPRARTLEAEVLDDRATLPWHNGGVVCLVIEYQQDDVLAHTWVRESDGLVLRQEASLWGETITLERE
jgi:hypothetical protein